MASVYKQPGWSVPPIIDLGEVGEKTPVTMPLVLNVPGPTVLKPQLTNMQVIIDRLPRGCDRLTIPAGGESLVYIRFLPGEFRKDTMLAGQIFLESQGETKEVWVIGQVLAEKEYKARARNEMILVGQSGHRYNFSATIVIGREQFRNEPGAGKLGENQVFVVREAADVWSIIQIRSQSFPTKINGIPLLPGHRRLLSGGEVIEIGDLRFTVESKEKKSSLKVDPCVEFGKLSTCRMAGAHLHIQNIGRGAHWEGRLRSTLFWIRVPEERVVCSSSQVIDVPLQLSPQAATLQQDIYTEYGALLLEDAQESWIMNARLEVDITGPVVEIEPKRIDLGRVHDPNTAAQSITIRNLGALDWEGSTRSTVDWLVVEPAMVTVPGGKTELISVKPSASISLLPEGHYKQEKAIIIEGQGLRENIAATIQIERPRALIEVDVAEFAFGKVSDWQKTSLIFSLGNKGSKDWIGRVISELSWLEVVDDQNQPPGEINLARGSQQKFKLRLNDSFRSLPEGSLKFEKAVHITGSDKIDFFCPVSLTIEAARIETDPAMLSFVIQKDPQTWEQVFYLWNRGGLEWSGQVLSSLPWLSVDDQPVTILPGRRKSFTAKINAQKAFEAFPEKKQTNLDRAIRIKEGDRFIGSISVSIIVTEKIFEEPKPAPPPIPQPPTSQAIIALGKVIDWQKPLARAMPVSNTRNQPLKVSISTRLSWLNIQPAEFEISPNGKANILVSLKPEASQLKNGVYNEPDAIVVQTSNYRRAYTIRLEVDVPPAPPPEEEQPLVDEISLGESPEATGKPEQKPEPPQVQEEEKKPAPKLPEYVIDFGEVVEWLPSMINRYFRLNNSTNLPLEGTAQCEVPWLRIEPEQFRIEPGGMLDLKVELKPTDHAESRIYDEKGAIIIKYGGLLLPIRVKAKITPVPGEKAQPLADTTPPPAAKKLQPSPAQPGEQPAPSPAQAQSSAESLSQEPNTPEQPAEPSPPTAGEQSQVSQEPLSPEQPAEPPSPILEQPGSVEPFPGKSSSGVSHSGEPTSAEPFSPEQSVDPSLPASDSHSQPSPEPASPEPSSEHVFTFTEEEIEPGSVQSDEPSTEL